MPKTLVFTTTGNFAGKYLFVSNLLIHAKTPA